MLAAFFLLALPAVCSAQMSDDQVIEYAKSALSAGKTQDQIGRELLSKGVTQSQAERLMKKMQSEQASLSVTDKVVSGERISRLSHSSVVNAGTDLRTTEDVTPEPTGSQDALIFGHNIFNSKALTFEPNENAATPENYRLGPGDQLTIDLWGDNEASIVQTVTPEGNIFISQIGRIQLSGLSINDAQNKISRLLKSKYANIGSGTSVSVRLSQIRTIMVNVMGDVVTPGTYRLSSFSTVFNALYRAGGVTDNGSMRAIKVIRGGQEIASVDTYGYLFDGKSDSDITLQDGDVVIVPTYVNLVSIKGKVKRPMLYEMLPDETLAELLEYSGGFTGDAYTGDFCVIRETGAERLVATVMADDASSFTLENGDAISVSSSLDRFANKIEVRGCVFRPGVYELGGSIATVSQLIAKAGGVTQDAFLPRALIMREKEDLSLELLPVSLNQVLEGEDVLLKKNDILVVSSIHELIDQGTLTIQGYVAEPGEFPYADNTTVEDLILQAGGLLDGASLARVDIARRVMDTTTEESGLDVGESFSFPIKDGFVIDGGENFFLKPYDVVIVRKSPSYFPQKFIRIEGQVEFPGTYALEKRDERLTDLIARAGGLTQFAYIPGTRIIRRAAEEDRYLNMTISELMSRNSARDSISTGNVLQDSYTVATNLQNALRNPGSTSDIVLREGDVVFVPEMINTVRIDGEVMFPTAVAYENGLSVRQYINMAGGFTQKAKRNRTYVIYADGHAAGSGKINAKVEPGSVIIVPTKREKDKASVSEIMATTSATTSIITMLSMLIDLFNPFNIQ